MTEKDSLKRQTLIQNFRDFADFLETHPEAPVPEFGIYLNVFAENADHFRALARTFGSELIEEDNSQWFTLRRRFGHISYDINLARGEPSERVVTEISG